MLISKLRMRMRSGLFDYQMSIDDLHKEGLCGIIF